MEELKAVQLSYSHKKLQAVSRELYLEHGWKMPRGLVNSRESDPRNYTLAEWQQAKRVGKDAAAIKTDIQDAYRSTFNQLVRSQRETQLRSNALATLENIANELNSRVKPGP